MDNLPLNIRLESRFLLKPHIRCLGNGSILQTGISVDEQISWMKVQVISILILALVLGLACPTPSWAYIDPNTLGFASQILAPLGTLLVSCLIYFRRKVSAGLSLGWRWLRKCVSKPRTDETVA